MIETMAKTKSILMNSHVKSIAEVEVAGSVGIAHNVEMKPIINDTIMVIADKYLLYNLNNSHAQLSINIHQLASREELAAGNQIDCFSGWSSQINNMSQLKVHHILY